ncbi:hypothetical protein A7Q09_04830 [Methylacidiphilum sp. Yel]|jgi:hypothetical protein|uniref:DUF3455 domain-containing protein n=1 Tax=Methylacidiphilum sp. Yel TaxID=1847730 RepID=UPI00106D8378|nr:DUF3455 domain-containing protein [Methylacidiphilum sp. Yel]TFE69762.1 hypothetical protein A7Q09_04830 [Methylacidiphilum sp. Yel]
MKNFLFTTFFFLFQFSLLFAQKNSGLVLPSHTMVVLVAEAKGVQIYSSQPQIGKKSSFEWKLTAPKALLFDKSGKQIGKHYSGPSWELNDGSKITTMLPPIAKVEQKTAIPWLLLKVKSHEGKGLLSNVQYVIRVATLGGLPPKKAPSKKNQCSKISYRATYLFLAKTTQSF